MPLIEKMFDDQLRLRLTSTQKRRLYDEARRQHVAGADLLRGFIDTLPDPDPLPVRKSRSGAARSRRAAA